MIFNNDNGAFDSFFPTSGSVGGQLEATTAFDLGTAYTIAKQAYQNNIDAYKIRNYDDLAMSNSFLGDYLATITKRVGSRTDPRYVSIKSAFYQLFDGLPYLTFLLLPISSFTIPDKEDAKANLKQHLNLIENWFLPDGVKVSVNCSTYAKARLEGELEFGNHPNATFVIDNNLTDVRLSYSR